MLSQHFSAPVYITYTIDISPLSLYACIQRFASLMSSQGGCAMYCASSLRLRRLSIFAPRQSTGIPDEAVLNSLVTPRGSIRYGRGNYLEQEAALSPAGQYQRHAELDPH